MWLCSIWLKKMQCSCVSAAAEAQTVTEQRVDECQAWRRPQVLDKSSGAVQAGFAHSPGLARLGEWLGGAQAGEGASVKLAGRLLDVLGALPIDTAALQGSGIGKCVKSCLPDLLSASSVLCGCMVQAGARRELVQCVAHAQGWVKAPPVPCTPFL
jgi:hypothetical protein